MAAKKGKKKPKVDRRKTGKKTAKCAVKRPCKASMSDKKYLASAGQRRATALAKYRAKKAGKSAKTARAPKMSTAEKVALGRKVLRAQRKWQKAQ